MSAGLGFFYNQYSKPMVVLRDGEMDRGWPQPLRMKVSQESMPRPKTDTISNEVTSHNKTAKKAGAGMPRAGAGRGGEEERGREGGEESVGL